MNAGQRLRPPRGAVIVIAIGLLATVAAALLEADASGSGVSLGWAKEAPIPATPKMALPGGGSARIDHAALNATLANFSGYRLYRASARLTIAPGSDVGGGRVRCRVAVPPTAIVAHTLKNRAAYPKPSPDLVRQGVPPEVAVKFNIHGSGLATVDLDDAFGTYTRTHGTQVDWEPYSPARQVWVWKLPPARPLQPVRLAFASMWRTTRRPQARVSCTVTTDQGSAHLATGGALGGGATSARGS